MLDSVTRDAPNLPSRVVLYAPEKHGKTSFGCHAPEPIFLMTKGETGLLSLIESGQVPPVAHFPNDFTEWGQLVGAVQALIREQHNYRTLVLDTGNGAELLLMAAVCNDAPFGGNWNEFNSYGRGIAACTPVWGSFLADLDTLRIKRGMAILFLHHAKVKTFSDPSGKDFDQWRPEAQDKLWGLTHKWADVIAFYGNRVKVYQDKAQGEQRFLRCNPSAAIVAGNRYGMPDEITSQPGGKNLWTAFATALRAAKSKGKQAQQPQAQPAATVPKPAEQPPEHPGDAYEGDHTLTEPVAH